MRGVYQTLLGYVLQIIKQATARNNTRRKDTMNRNEFSLDPVSSESNAKNIHDAKKAIKDNAQAGIPVKLDFFAFFSIIMSLSI